MAKELPYFKFNAAEWISGEITLEDLTTQGAFINICAYYWFKSGCLTLTEIKRRLKLKQATIDRLTNNNHIKVDGDQVEISFLKQQFDERGHISKQNSENGKKGGAPKGNSNAKNPEKNNREQAKTTNIEENKKREEKEEKREEENLLSHLGIEVSIKKLLEDELWIHNITPIVKGKDLAGGARAAFLFLQTKPQRFEQADLNELKKVTLSWLQNAKADQNGNGKISNSERMKAIR